MDYRKAIDVLGIRAKGGETIPEVHIAITEAVTALGDFYDSVQEPLDVQTVSRILPTGLKVVFFRPGAGGPTSVVVEVTARWNDQLGERRLRARDIKP